MAPTSHAAVHAFSHTTILVTLLNLIILLSKFTNPKF
jgi:hypothetical protein